MPKDIVFSPKADWPWSDPAEALFSAYRLGEAARITYVARAIGTGLVALIAKDIVGHGKFAKWIEADRLAEVNLRTVQRYMKVARACIKAADLKPETIRKSAFLRWAVEGGDVDDCKVWKAVADYIGERTLSEIYDDEGITREVDPHQKHSPTKNPPEISEQLTFEDKVRGWDTITTQLTALGHIAKSHFDIPSDKRWAFLDTAVPVIRDIALSTELSPAQRRQLENELVSITTALRAPKASAA